MILTLLIKYFTDIKLIKNKKSIFIYVLMSSTFSWFINIEYIGITP